MATSAEAVHWLKLATPPLDERSKYLRRLVVRALEGGERGHVGSSMSLIEIMRVLYDDVLRYRPDEPKWPDRDRMILSKGHGCLALYVMLADKGFFPLETLDTFCRRDSILGGHPEAGKVPGVEASTGALGHGLSIGVGMALAARIAEARQPRVRRDGRRRDQRGLGVGSRDVRRQAPAVQPHRHRSTTTRSSRPARRARSRISSRCSTNGAPSVSPPSRSTATTSTALRDVFRAPAARARPADRDHLPHGEGQGHCLRRERCQLAPQVQDRPRRRRQDCTQRLE